MSSLLPMQRLGQQYAKKNPKSHAKMKSWFSETTKNELCRLIDSQYPSLYQRLMDHLGVQRKNQVSHEQLFLFLFPEERTTCLTCGKPTKYAAEFHRYREFCSQKCLNSNPITVQRREQTMQDRYGAKNANEVKEFKEKAKDTLQRNYGVSNASHSPEIQAKKVETSLKKRGVRHHSMDQEYKEQMVKNNPMYEEENKERLKKTNLERYGVENASKNKEVIKKIERTHQERYGCNAGALAELQPNAKTVVDRFGVKHTVVGYEHLAVEYLSGKKQITRIDTVSRDIGGINYVNAKGKRTKYYPDMRFYVGSSGKPHLVEVKSKNSLLRGNGEPDYFENCMLKFAAATQYCRKAGGNFWLFLYVGQHTDPKLVKIKNPTCVQDLLDAGVTLKVNHSL